MEEFAIIEKTTARGLAESVNEFLQKGWHLKGDVQIIISQSQVAGHQQQETKKYSHVYIQAMVRSR